MSVRILAIDTSTEACSVALLNDNDTSSLYEDCPQQHTKKILPMVDKLLADSHLKLTDLDAIAVTRGPGSFTGIRIGISVAQGLAFGIDKPLIPISTLNVLAQGAYQKRRLTDVLCAIDARMGEVYWAKYHYDPSGEWQIMGEEQVIQPTSLIDEITQIKTQYAYAGTGWPAYFSGLLVQQSMLIDGQTLLPHSQDILPLALTAYQKGHIISADKIEPIYLRNDVAWKKSSGK